MKKLDKGQNESSFENLFLRVTRPESRIFKPYFVPQEAGFARMHQNESYLPLNQDELARLYNEFADVLKDSWKRNDSSPNIYPSLVPLELKKAYASYLDLQPTQVEVFSGSSEALLTIASGCFRPGAKVAFLKPSFSLLADLVQFWGAEYVPIALDDDLKCIRESLFSESVLNADVTILCTPNNPTGSVIPAEWIVEFVGLAKGLVVIDEAYFEFARVIDKTHFNFAPLATSVPNAVVLRTLSKAWGAAGLRIGALAGSENWVRFFAGLRRPYSIPQPSEILGAFVLERKVPLMEKIVHNSVQSCLEIANQLAKLGGLRTFSSFGNFLLIDTPHAKEIATRCYEEQIIVRQFDFASQTYLRVSPWAPEDNAKFVQVVREFHESRSGSQ